MSFITFAFSFFRSRSNFLFCHAQSGQKTKNEPLEKHVSLAFSKWQLLVMINSGKPYKGKGIFLHKVKRCQVYLNKVQTILSLHCSRKTRLEFENLKEPKEPNVFPNQTPKTNKIIFCTPQKDVKNVWSSVSDFKRFLFQQALWSIYKKNIFYNSFCELCLYYIHTYVKASCTDVVFTEHFSYIFLLILFELEKYFVKTTYYISISFSRKL